MQFHPRRTQQRSDRFRRAALPPNHFAEVFGMDAKFEDGHLRTLDGPDLYSLWVIYKRSSDLLHKFLHWAPMRTGRPSATASGGLPVEDPLSTFAIGRLDPDGV